MDEVGPYNGNLNCFISRKFSYFVCLSEIYELCIRPNKDKSLSLIKVKVITIFCNYNAGWLVIYHEH